MASKDLAAALKLADDKNLRFVSLKFTDIVGAVKSVQVPMHQLEDAVEHGKWFDGSSIEGFARIAESDMFLMPDLSTFAVIPWDLGDYSAARVICWVFNPNGELFEGDPRAVLARVLQEARDLGYTYNTGPELEFFLFKPDEQPHAVPLPYDRGGYFDYSTDLAYQTRKEMVYALEAMGIK